MVTTMTMTMTTTTTTPITTTTTCHGNTAVRLSIAFLLVNGDGDADGDGEGDGDGDGDDACFQTHHGYTKYQHSKSQPFQSWQCTPSTSTGYSTAVLSTCTESCRHDGSVVRWLGASCTRSAHHPNPPNNNASHLNPPSTSTTSTQFLLLLRVRIERLMEM